MWLYVGVVYLFVDILFVYVWLECFDNGICGKIVIVVEFVVYCVVELECVVGL